MVCRDAVPGWGGMGVGVLLANADERQEQQQDQQQQQQQQWQFAAHHPIVPSPSHAVAQPEEAMGVGRQPAGGHGARPVTGRSASATTTTAAAVTVGEPGRIPTAAGGTSGGCHADGAAGSGAAPLVAGVRGAAYRCATHTVSKTVAESTSGIVLPTSVVSELFPGIWRRVQEHLDARVKVQILDLPVTLVLASLPEGDPGREVQVGGGVRGTVRRWM